MKRTVLCLDPEFGRDPFVRDPSGTSTHEITPTLGVQTKKATILDDCLFVVGVAGFEPTTPCSQSRCANRTALHPEKPVDLRLVF